MIERFIKKDITLRRWRIFKRQKISFFSLFAFLIICFFSFTAEFWANSKPIYLKHQGKTYFPTFKTYHPSEFEGFTGFKADYREIAKTADSVVWPFIQWDPYESNNVLDTYPSKPSFQNLMGTDDRGRDVLTRTLYGFRYSITYAFLVWAVSLFIAIILGGLMGYFGGWFDLVGQRVVEVMDTIPILFILLILASIFKPNLWLLVAITSVFGWIFFSRYVRAEFLKLRKRSFVEVGGALGASHARIIFKHILPNSLVPIITFSPFIIAGHIYSLSALDYLGFGLQPPTPSWGELLSQARDKVTYAWWLAVFPSIALFVTLALLGLVGNGVRSAMDPKK